MASLSRWQQEEHPRALPSAPRGPRSLGRGPTPPPHGARAWRGAHERGSEGREDPGRTERIPAAPTASALRPWTHSTAQGPEFSLSFEVLKIHVSAPAMARGTHPLHRLPLGAGPAAQPQQPARRPAPRAPLAWGTSRTRGAGFTSLLFGYFCMICA